MKKSPPAKWRAPPPTDRWFMPTPKDGFVHPDAPKERRRPKNLCRFQVDLPDDCLPGFKAWVRDNQGVLTFGGRGAYFFKDEQGALFKLFWSDHVVAEWFTSDER